MNRIIILFFLILLCCTSCNRKATVSFSTNEEKSLVALGQLWGFLKYHHPAVAKGNYDWDAELIKLIPKILEAKNDSTWKKLLVNWVDSLPPIPENPKKKLPDLEIKMKPDYGELFNTEYFLPETIDKIKYILDNAVISTNHYLSVTERRDASSLLFTNEDTYEDMLYPELPYRLLALFRFWNCVNYFYPYRELCDQKWADVLADMLPEFINAKNQKEYIFACLKLITKIDDSHGFFYPNLNAGLLGLPINTQFIEDKLVVTTFTGEDAYVKEKIKVGDAITAINGEPVEDIVKRMLPYIPASNYAVKLREISNKILTGNTASFTLTIQRDGKSFQIKIPCYDRRLLKDYNYYSPQQGKEAYRVLDNNIGYVLPSNCTAEDLERGIKKVLDGTKGVIIDMRCYPNYHFTAQMFSSHFNTDSIQYDRSGFSNVSYPGYVFISRVRDYAPDKLFYQSDRMPKNKYTKKVVVIVNEYTQSQAETHVMVYQTAPNVVVIGSTTAGADGVITNFKLPGNIRVTMTGAGVYYPDGSNLQRAGVKIDEIVKPTIAGIKAGRDELLERAIEIINESR